MEKKLDSGAIDKYTYFTGKPHVEGLGYSFLFRNYREDLSKWQTSDPLGYPDGWNNFAYVNNGVTNSIDWLGGVKTGVIDQKVDYDELILSIYSDVYSNVVVQVIGDLSIGNLSIHFTYEYGDNLPPVWISAVSQSVNCNYDFEVSYETTDEDGYTVSVYETLTTPELGVEAGSKESDPYLMNGFLYIDYYLTLIYSIGDVSSEFICKKFTIKAE